MNEINERTKNMQKDVQMKQDRRKNIHGDFFMKNCPDEKDRRKKT